MFSSPVKWSNHAIHPTKAAWPTSKSLSLSKRWLKIHLTQNRFQDSVTLTVRWPGEMHLAFLLAPQLLNGAILAPAMLQLSSCLWKKWKSLLILPRLKSCGLNAAKFGHGKRNIVSEAEYLLLARRTLSTYPESLVPNWGRKNNAVCISPWEHSSGVTNTVT